MIQTSVIQDESVKTTTDDVHPPPGPPVYTMANAGLGKKTASSSQNKKTASGSNPQKKSQGGKKS